MPACTKCRPIIIDRVTENPLPETHPVLKAILAIWDAAPEAEREAYHRVFCKKSESGRDVAAFRQLRFWMKVAGAGADERMRGEEALH